MSIASKSVRVARLVGAAVVLGVFSIGAVASPAEAANSVKMMVVERANSV